jgi:hypothetical protein
VVSGKEFVVRQGKHGAGNGLLDIMREPGTGGNAEAKSDQSIRRLALGISIGAPVLLALFNLLLGKDANWDFLNYRYYNPFAFLQGRLAIDVAVAHHASYYNPLVDLPFYLAARAFSARTAGFLLAFMQGLNFVPLFWLTWIVLPLKCLRLRLVVATLSALAGMTGGGVLGQLGVVATDNLVSLGVLGALWIIVWKLPQLQGGSLPVAAFWALAAGVAAGGAAGLKLTAALFCVGLCLALLVLPVSIPRRLQIAFGFGLGVLVGMALFTLPWSLQLWHRTGNPLFPYFNGFFRSTLISVNFNRDMAFIPTELCERVFFPFYFSINSFYVAEFFFRDVRLLMVFILLPLWLLLPRMRLFHSRASNGPAACPPAARFLLAAAAFSYLTWLKLFCIYRYLLPLEMLAPLLIALCLDRLPISLNKRLAVLVIVLLGSQVAAYSAFDERQAWGEHYVEVSVPPIPRPAETLVLITGTIPVGYAIPHFPSGIAFLRIQSYMTGGELLNGLDLEMHRRVAAHHGDLFVLFHPSEREVAEKALTAYGLAMGQDGCRPLLSNVASPLLLCSLRRPP